MVHCRIPACGTGGRPSAVCNIRNRTNQMFKDAANATVLNGGLTWFPVRGSYLLGPVLDDGCSLITHVTNGWTASNDPCCSNCTSAMRLCADSGTALRYPKHSRGLWRKNSGVMETVESVRFRYVDGSGAKIRDGANPATPTETFSSPVAEYVQEG